MHVSSQFCVSRGGVYIPAHMASAGAECMSPRWRLLEAIAASSTSAGDFTLADIPNQGARWDMVDSSVTTSAGNVTQVTDLVGSNHLVTETTESTEGSIAPDDISSDAALGSRRACQHNLGASEALESGSLSQGSPYTFWMIGTLDGVLSTFHPLMCTDSTAGVGGAFDNGSSQWALLNDTDGDVAGTVVTPVRNASVLLVWIFNGTSSEMWANGTDDSPSIPGTWGTPTCTRILIGYHPGSFSYGSFTWTVCGYTTDAMSSATIANLEQWRQDNAS